MNQTPQIHHRHSKAHHQIDMLSGPLLPKIIAFALPLAFTSILQQLFNATDTAIVGRFTENGMAAVGVNSQIVNILVGFASGLAVGINVHIAGLIGRGEEERIKGAIQTILFLAIASGLFTAMIGITFSKSILELMKAPADILPEAIRYTRIYCLGLPFVMLYNFGSAILRSRGDTRRPLYALAASGVINIVLNLFFVVVLKMGVAGVATATDISTAISAGIIVRIVLKEEVSEDFFTGLHINPALLAQICKIGLPAAFQGMLFSISNMFVQTAINSFGADAISGNTAALNYEILSYYIALAISQTVVTFTSQNLGAGNMERCRKSYLLCMGLSVAVLFALNTTVVSFGEFFLSFFTTSEAVMEQGLLRFHIVLIYHVLICSYEISAGALRGYGFAMTPTIISIVGTCLLRPAWIATYFSTHRSMEVLLRVYPISWVFTGIAMLSAYYLLVVRKRA
ncbi:MAG: MATE family efflux transporter [Lachnospiraceae bacterium]|nr:MATE family efflux transporter [Lachnospiraceae bacterium]